MQKTMQVDQLKEDPSGRSRLFTFNDNHAALHPARASVDERQSSSVSSTHREDPVERSEMGPKTTQTAWATQTFERNHVPYRTCSYINNEMMHTASMILVTSN